MNKNMNKRRSSVGRIINKSAANIVIPNQAKHNDHRSRAGSITGLTPKRNTSIGKIVVRSSSLKSHKSIKTMSISTQTQDIILCLQNKGIQAMQQRISNIAPKNQSKSKIHFQQGFLRIADQSQDTETQQLLLSKTMKKKKDESNKENRTKKILELSAVYEKNLVKYEASKQAIGSLLQDKRDRGG